MTARILVIDDDQSILELFRSILQGEEGYDVHLSTFAFEEITDVEHLHPDLVILDMKIGSHNEGWLLMQKLRMYRPTKDIPIILCTAALLDVREQEETLRQKGIPIVYKPFDIDELVQVVHQQLSPSQERTS